MMNSYAQFASRAPTWNESTSFVSAQIAVHVQIEPTNLPSSCQPSPQERSYLLVIGARGASATLEQDASEPARGATGELNRTGEEGLEKVEPRAFQVASLPRSTTSHPNRPFGTRALSLFCVGTRSSVPSRQWTARISKKQGFGQQMRLPRSFRAGCSRCPSSQCPRARRCGSETRSFPRDPGSERAA